MTIRAPKNAEILKTYAGESAELRAVKANLRGRMRLLLEVNATRLAAWLGDEVPLAYRCSEYENEAELMVAFDRAAVALAR